MVETFFKFRLAEIEGRLGRGCIAIQSGVDLTTVDHWLVRGFEPLVSYAFAVALGTGFDVDDLIGPEPLSSEPRRAPQRQTRSPLFKDTGRTRFCESALELANARKITRRRLADELCLDLSTVKKWLASRSEPRVGNALALAEFFGVTVHGMCLGRIE
jgi:hypothetical protein